MLSSLTLVALKRLVIRMVRSGLYSLLSMGGVLTLTYLSRLSSVAVTGLPRPQKNHASIMVRFACEARAKMRDLVQELEVELGPGTADLRMR